MEISFETLDSQDGEFYIDEEKSSQEFENILEDENEIFIFNDTDFQESPLEATENNYIDKNFSRINLLNSEEEIVENISIPENLDYTTVDLTDLATGEIITHDCNLYLITNFDDAEHWNECSICGKILNKETHNYTDSGWTGGSASNCNENNVHLFTCECGSNYSNTEGRLSHSFDNGDNSIASYQFYRVCTKCAAVTDRHDCMTASGERMNCLNAGKCALCGYTYTPMHRINFTDGVNKTDPLGDLYCGMCSTYMGTGTYYNVTYTSDSYMTFTSTVSLPSGYKSLSCTWYIGNKNVTKQSYSSGLTQTLKVRYTAHEEFTSTPAVYWTYYVGSMKYQICAAPYAGPEATPPVITNISTNSSDEWSTDTTISVTGTENYCYSVNLSLKDTEENFLLQDISIPVSSKNWSYEIKPDLEANENKEYILVVSDTLKNTTEQSFYMCKTDIKPPVFVENTTMNEEWSRTKNSVMVTTDKGIGQVQNSVINTENYESATENENIFYKGYTFTGDVYGDVFVPVYFKDGLENTDVEFVKVSNLDNTEPTIEDIIMNKTLHNTEVVISANDINEKLNATGSGVTGYAISKENNIPSEFQEENTFNIFNSGKYYLFVTDAVGNVSSRELNIPVQYKVTINPDGGTWKGDILPQEYIADNENPINLYPEPEKKGYIFKEWEISGEGEITEDGELIINGDVTVTPIWEANKYEITFIDYDITNNRIMNTVTRELDFNSEISGTCIGNDEADNAYYPQYRLISDTSVIISTNSENNVVYRYFEFCYTEKESHLNFNDDNNKDGLRPDTYKLQLILEDGELIQEVELPTSRTDYIFENLPKYNPQGEEYKYKIIPIISDRYDVLPNPEGESTPEISYNNPECSIKIPKVTTLDGKDGDLTYTIQVEANLFYEDKIIIIPEENVILTDGIENMNATITQDKTEFNKEDELKITGKIQTTKKHFAGVWHGTFNFKIKYEVKN